VHPKQNPGYAYDSAVSLNRPFSPTLLFCHLSWIIFPPEFIIKAYIQRSANIWWRPHAYAVTSRRLESNVRLHH